MCTSRQLYTLLEHAFMHCWNIVIYAVGTIICIVLNNSIHLLAHFYALFSMHCFDWAITISGNGALPRQLFPIPT